MIPPLAVVPRGLHGPAPEVLRIEPARCSLIKEEKGTVIWRQLLPDGTPAICKCYRHRKPSVFQQLHLDQGRAEREFNALSLLEQHHVPCSTPLFWAQGTAPETGRYEVLVTREIAGAIDLRNWLRQHLGAPPPDLRPLFAVAAAMHRAGLQHGAFVARNILLAGREFLLLDLARCHVFGRSIEGRGPGLFDLQTLLQNLAPHLPDSVLVPALAGYGALPVEASELVSRGRLPPRGRRHHNLWHTLYSVQAAGSRFLRPRMDSP